MAQNKAVAVTEVVDKEGKVSYAIEIMVRTRLTAAISMKQGYTAYDRVDLQSIMSEQNFQRTGLVDDATIKRLGQMTGASLILIPEVAMSDDGKIYVAVKMLDVTTAQTMMATGELMGSSSEEVEEGCRALTAKVLGVRSGSSSTAAASDKPVTLFGYLHVFPTDLGEFQTLPTQLMSAINKNASYGYDSWRLPTTEELSIMRANSHLIPNFRNTDYLCSDSSVKGLARLVTTGMSVAEKENNEMQKIKSNQEEAIPFILVEEKPSFQGGDANAFSKWVNTHLKYPEIAKRNGVQGRVTLQFTIEKDGSVTNVGVLRGVEPSLDKEAVRVVSMSPKWKPGKQRDRYVPVTYTFPVIFQLL